MERGYKYHGLGNDFLVLDRRDTGRDIDAERARALCERHRGVGADGVLVLLPERGVAARMVVHNADGTVAESCGNGLRCVVKYLVDRGGVSGAEVKVATGAGVVACRPRLEGGAVAEVEVEMGQAEWRAANLPARGGEPFVDAPVEGHPGLRGTAVSMGNPHLVLFDRPLDEADHLGAELERAAGFRERTNVEWVRAEGEGFRVVVWERGVGLTQACGTGACAVAAAAVRTGRAEKNRWLAIALPGGRLDVRVGEDGRVTMRGPATFVFEASL